MSILEYSLRASCVGAYIALVLLGSVTGNSILFFPGAVGLYGTARLLVWESEIGKTKV